LLDFRRLRILDRCNQKGATSKILGAGLSLQVSEDIKDRLWPGSAIGKAHQLLSDLSVALREISDDQCLLALKMPVKGGSRRSQMFDEFAHANQIRPASVKNIANAGEDVIARLLKGRCHSNPWLVNNCKD
jgi:hypothetical protein